MNEEDQTTEPFPVDTMPQTPLQDTDVLDIETTLALEVDETATRGFLRFLIETSRARKQGGDAG